MISLLQYAPAGVAIHEICAFCWRRYSSHRCVLVLLKCRRFCSPLHLSPHFRPSDGISCCSALLCKSIIASVSNCHRHVTTIYTSLHTCAVCVCVCVCVCHSSVCVCGKISRMFSCTGSAGVSRQGGWFTENPCTLTHIHTQVHTSSVSQNCFIKALPVELLGLDPLTSHRPRLNYNDGREQRKTEIERETVMNRFTIRAQFPVSSCLIHRDL